MSKEPNIFGLIEYSRHDLFVDSTDAVREADRFYIMIEADAVLKGQEELIAEKDAEIARLKDRSLDVKDAAHVLKAFKFYLCQLTHCAYDELTAQWIIDNWEQDYKRVEEYKG